MTATVAPDDVAAHVLELVARRRPDAQAQASVTRQTRSLTRFAESFIHQNVADSGDTVALALYVDGRTATVSGNQTTTGALDTLVDAALTAAALRPVDDGYSGLTETGPAAAGGRSVDPGTAAGDPEDRAGVVRAFVDAADGLACAGFVQTIHRITAYANSSGRRVTGSTTQADLDAIARTGSSDGCARTSSPALSDVDGRRLGAEAAAKARAGTDPVELPPGSYQVVLEPGAVADVVSGLMWQGLNGKAANEGRSFARVGEQQFDPRINLWDDSGDAAATGLRFDAEGTDRPRLDLITGGVTTALPYDRRSAAVAGRQSTGHAVSMGGQIGAIPLDVRLGAGDGVDLVAGVERGLLVSDFWYTRALDPMTLVYTGLTRNGVWLIEDGRIGPAVSTLRFTQSYVDALGPGRVLGVSAATQASPRGVTTFFDLTGSLLIPSLWLSAWNITGNAAG